MRMVLIICLLATAWPTPAGAATCPPGGCPAVAPPTRLAPVRTRRSPHQAPVVRVVNQLGATRALGSGTLVDQYADRGLVLTCAHTFRDGVGEVTVVLATGRAFGARVVKIDRQWDLAALMIRRPEVEPATVAAKDAQPGEALASCGYGSAGRFWCNRGRAQRYVIAEGTHTAETLELSGAARQGDSGGPIFNDQGELVGIVLGTNGRIVTGTACGRIRAFLAGLSPRFRQSAPQPTPVKQAPPQTQPPQVKPAAPNDSDAADDPDDRPPPAGLQRLGDSVADLRRRIQTVDERIKHHADALDERLERVATIAGALDHRLQTAEAVLDEDNLRQVIRRAVASTAIAGRFDPVKWLWPLVGGALGLSAPPVLAVVAWKAVRCWLHRRRRGRLLRVRRRRRSTSRHRTAQTDHITPPSDTPRVTRQLNDDYADELNRLFAHSGRSPAQDATLGREYDEQLSHAAESSDPKLAEWARKLRNQVQTKFHRIHGLAPAPAEPVEQRAESRERRAESYSA